MTDVSIIILSWNTRKMLADCLDAVERFHGAVSIEIIVVDNHSSDDSLAMLRERYPSVRVIANSENVGFARGNNQGVQAACGRYVLLLNSDAFLTEGALPALLAFAEAHPKAGMTGARLVNSDGSFQASFTPIPTLKREFFILSGLGRLLYGSNYPSRGAEVEAGPQRAGYVEGACMLAPREAYLEVGGLDEGYFMYAEDVDLCFAMQRHGWEVWYHPGAVVVHLGGASSKNRKPQREADLYKSRVRFFRKYYGARQAGALKVMIYFFTAVKNIYHGGLRLVSGGKWGRPVVSIRLLANALKEA